MSDTIIGPSLPVNFMCDDDDDDVMGPQLPPNYYNNRDKSNKLKDETKPESAVSRAGVVIGPVIPEHLKEKLKTQNINDNSDDEDSDDIIGPLPPDGNETSDRYKNRPVMRGDSAKSNEKPKREEWMMIPPKSMVTKLPTKSVTSFSKKRPSDSKSDKNDEEFAASEKERNDTMTQMLDEYNQNNKRDKSLLEMHREKRKKSKISSKPKERVPFDAETDLEIRKFDSRQTKSVIEKAQLLSARFSQGKSKFL